MIDLRRSALCASATLAFASMLQVAWAHDGHRHPAPAISAQSVKSDAVRVDVPKVALVDQDGHPVRLGTDLLGSRLAVVNFVYTSCTSVCPMQSVVFSALQDALGERLGRTVELISMTVDPINDQAEQMKRYAQARGAREGWRWLTGDRRSVEQALKGFGAFTADYTQHPAMVLVGDPQRGEWSRFYGFPAPEVLMRRLDELAAARASLAPSAAMIRK